MRMKKTLRYVLIIALALTIATVALKGDKVEPSKIESVSSKSPIVHSDILAIVNRHRTEGGLVLLEENVTLTRRANKRAESLFNFGKLTHDGWLEAYNETGVRACYKGENLACCFANSEQVVNGWINSPKHKEIMLSNLYRYAGIGVYQDYVVMWFASEN